MSPGGNFVQRPQPFLSIVIPAYNEEKRLPASLRLLEEFFRSLKRGIEVIVVDDASRDNTAEAARTQVFSNARLRVLRNRRNRGKGASVRRGMAAARGAYILFSDADFSTPIREWERLYQALQAGAGVAIGSRAVTGARVTRHQPFYREWMGKAFNRFVQWIVLPGLHDTQCGFKLFTRATARRIFCRVRTPRFGFDVEVLYLARRAGIPVAEVPVEWKNSAATTVSPLKDSAIMFWDLFRIRIRHRRTRV
jgi:dolichyl-phosphate beta-glucosyltransferase